MFQLVDEEGIDDKDLTEHALSGHVFLVYP